MGWREIFDKGFEFFQIFADDFVIVAAVSVAGDARVIWFEFFLGVIVICCEDDDAFGAGENFCEICALSDFFHVGHLPVMILGDPIFENFNVFRVDFCLRKAD